MAFADFVVDDPGGAGAGEVLASIRPQCLTLRARNGEAAPCERGVVHLPARIGERVFLGERWDYGVVVEGGGATLRAAAPAEQVFDLEAPVWISIRQERIVPVEGA